MIKRIVEISRSGAKLSVRNGQLVVDSRDEEGARQIPCEDIGLLLVDHGAVVYTHGVFVELLKHGAGVVFCGGDHHPAGMLLPAAANSVQTERMRRQLSAKEPLKKQLWRQLVQAKIRHQAAVLGIEHEQYKPLRGLAEKVRSGDKGNLEAQASRRYWNGYLGELEFRRRVDGSPPNNLLNYGYAVVRAAVARALTGAGLLCSLGVHHHSKYNAFCLADDVMEPFRGFVDAKVADVWERDEVGEDLTQELKAEMLNVLYEPVVVEGQKGPLMVSLHKTAASLVRCYAGEGKELALPKL